MNERYSIGDHVSWNSEAGRVSGMTASTMWHVPAEQGKRVAPLMAARR